MDKLTLIKVGGKIVEEQETLSRLMSLLLPFPRKRSWYMVAVGRPPLWPPAWG